MGSGETEAPPAKEIAGGVGNAANALAVSAREDRRGRPVRTPPKKFSYFISKFNGRTNMSHIP
jgi:hypothetical protein